MTGPDMQKAEVVSPTHDDVQVINDGEGQGVWVGRSALWITVQRPEPATAADHLGDGYTDSHRKRAVRDKGLPGAAVRTWREARTLWRSSRSAGIP